MIALLTLWAGACAPRGGDPWKKQPTVSLRVLTSERQVGEAVLAIVSVVNTTPEAIEAQQLSARSVEFWTRQLSDEGGRLIEPVYSEHDPSLGALITLEPHDLAPNDAITTRIFVFTDLAEQPGERLLMANYRAYSPNQTESLPIPSEPQRLRVRAPRRFERDRAGLLTAEQAQQAALEHYGLEDGRAECVMRRDRAGFFEWHVNVYEPGADKASKACYVNPYLGHVSRDADPYSPKAHEQNDLILRGITDEGRARRP